MFKAHFWKAALEDETNPDWLPSLTLILDTQKFQIAKLEFQSGGGKLEKMHELHTWLQKML